jgi:class 3 adenylate cyclase
MIIGSLYAMSGGLALTAYSQVAVINLPATQLDQQSLKLNELSWSYLADRFAAHKPAPAGLPEIPMARFWQLEDRGENPPAADRATFYLTIELDTARDLAILFPDYPFYRLYLDHKLIHRHGRLGDDGQVIAARGFDLVPLGFDKTFHLALEVDRSVSNWFEATTRLSTYENLKHLEQREILKQSFMIGAMFVTAIYQFSLFFLIPNRRPPLFFGMFLVCIGLRAMVSNLGQPMFILLPEFSWELSWKIGFIGYYLSVPAMIQFIHDLFRNSTPKWVLRLAWLTAGLFSVIALVTTVDTYATINWTYNMFTLAVMFIAVFGFLRAYRMRQTGSRILILAVLALTGTAVNDILLLLGILTTPPMVNMGILIFIVSQTIIISLKYSMAYKNLDHLYRELRKIVYDHVISRLARGFPIEQTMPIGKEEGIALHFDIVGSSHIHHPGFPQALEAIMSRCHQTLSENYDPQALTANGYRIKEMGDGLLCSIGFPFRTPNGQKPEELALYVAEQFATIFREEMETLQDGQSYFCGIGLARGPIEGFFPKEGTQEYDVRGRALTLATRYENMRNLVFKNYGRQGSVIFIQDDVYQRLPVRAQKQFRNWDCEQEQAMIRDDPKANQAWFKIMTAANPSLSTPLPGHSLESA